MLPYAAKAAVLPVPDFSKPLGISKCSIVSRMLLAHAPAASGTATRKTLIMLLAGLLFLLGETILFNIIESEKEIRIRTEEKPGREVIEEGFVTLSGMFSDKGSSNLIKKIDPQLVRNLSLSITQPESRAHLSEKE